MIIDAHAHIFPEKIAAKAAQGIGDFYDIHMDSDGTLDTLLKLSDEAGVDICLVHSVATVPHQVESINDFISQSVAAHPDRLIGFAAMHPDYEDIGGEIRRCVEELGLKGIKLHPDFQKFRIDDPVAFPIYEAAVKYSVPVLFHTGDTRYDFSGPERLRRAADMFPDMKIIGAHFAGWSQWDQAYELFKDGRIYTDISSSMYMLTPERAADIIRNFGADKVLFGTDYPMWTAKEELERFYAIPLTDDERELILHKNAERLLGLEQK